MNADEGSLAWAWTRSRRGQIDWERDDFESAAKHYRAISEIMPAGSEKIRALMDLARCQQSLGKHSQAVTTLNAAMAHPNVQWKEITGEKFLPLNQRWGESQAIAKWWLGISQKKLR